MARAFQFPFCLQRGKVKVPPSKYWEKGKINQVLEQKHKKMNDEREGPGPLSKEEKDDATAPL